MNLPTPTDLSHVFWIGGSPCSGKSTISRAMAQIYVFLEYHADAWTRNHLARRITQGNEQAAAFAQMSPQERWSERSVATLVEEAITSWTNDFPLVLEDLLAFPKDNLLVAEGNFFPASILPYLSHPHQALWLVPTATFCEQGRRQRWAEQDRRRKRQGLFQDNPHIEQQHQAIIARDREVAHYVRQQAEVLQLPYLVIDGTRSREAMQEVVEHHFDPYISSALTHRAS
jgi:hypothetical protein